jgi:hypothetical protein
MMMDRSSAWDTPLNALRVYWWVIFVLIVVGVVAGVAYGVYRDEEYTAEATLSVGRVDVATQAIPGFAVAARLLADTYSRAIVADGVVSEVAKRTGLSKDEVVDSLSATPIPETATIHVNTEADAEGKAIREANAAAFALVEYVRRLNKNSPGTRRLLRDYNDAARAFSAAKDRVRRLGPTADRQAAVLEEKLKLKAAGGLYARDLAGQSSPNTLQLLAKAARAEDDRDSTIQQAAFAGGVAGLMIGALLAILIYRRRGEPINAA